MSVTSFFRGLDWIGTARLAVLRAIAASLVWVVVISIFIREGGQGSTPNNPVVAIIALPLIILLVILPVAALATALGRAGVPVAGPFGIFLACFCAVGDPLVWILHQIKPAWLGVERFSFFNPAFLFVYKQRSEQQPNFGEGSTDDR